jgi:hypothetical protein
VIIFSLLILLGFVVSIRSLTTRHLVTVIYLLTLFWYTFGCRIRYSTPVYGDDTVVTTPAAAPTFTEQVLKLIRAIFGSQPDGTLAGGGVAKAMAFNGLLFIPLGYLLLLWIPVLRQKRSGWVAAVLITAGVSIAVELTQAITGLGMADSLDTVANLIGGVIGIGMVKEYDPCVTEWMPVKDDILCGV